MNTRYLFVRTLLFLVASCSMLIAQSAHGTGNKGREYICEQPPVFNSPTGCQGGALGLADGCQACESNDVVSSVDLGSEAILLHSGQEVCTATDLYLKGRDHGVNLRIMRRHTTRVDEASSLFGPAWSFNYRHTFELDGTDLTFNGFGRTDSFDAVVGNANHWNGNQGRLDRAFWTKTSIDPAPIAGTMTVRRPHGTRLLFHGEDRGDGVIVGHMVEVVSPNENHIKIVYESAVTEPILLDRRILKLVDSYGRDLDCTYYPDDVLTTTVDESRLILAITDQTTPRQVVYLYTGKDLTSVLTPEVASTGGVNDFTSAAGNRKTTNYTYRGLTGTLLEHALTSVTYPNEVAISGSARLAWTYQEVSGPFFGFVETHTVGNGTFDYSCQNLTVTPGMVNIDTPVITIDVSDRRGVETQVTMNYLGQMLTEGVKVSVAPVLRTGAPSGPYGRTFSYTPDGLLKSATQPLGNKVEHKYDDGTGTGGTPATRLTFGNLLEKKVTPDVGRLSPYTYPTIVHSYQYEPVYNRKVIVTDPRGYATTHIFDYMENLNAAAVALAPQMGLLATDLSNEFARLLTPDFAGVDVNGDGLTNQFCGNVIKIEYPVVSLPAQAADAPFSLPLAQSAVELFAFNAFGQRTRRTDAEENVHEWLYFDATSLTSGTAGVAGGGYLAEYREDTTAGPGRNTSTNPSVVNRVTKYGYGSVSGFPANNRGVPTQVIDPRGIETHRLVNELDQVVQEVRAAVVPLGSGLTALSYVSITKFDANDNVVETHVEDSGNPSGSSGFIETNYAYDILDFVTEQVRDVGGVAIVTGYKYDASQNRTVELRGAGTPEASRTEWTYDERDIVFTTTRGVGAIDAVTATKIDSNGNVTQHIDAVSQANAATSFTALSGDVTTYVYDGYDRRRQTIDRRGLETTRLFDASGNMTNALQRGDCNSVLTPFAVTDLAETDFIYDERDRRVRTNRHVFHVAAAAGYSKGAIDPGALDDPADGIDTASSVTIYDRASRAIGILDADKDAHRVRFDGVNRELSVLDPVGNLAESIYDASNNLLSWTETESAANTPVVLSDEVFVTQCEYDALNRRTKMVEPIGASQTIQFFYDSRDNLIRTNDAEGNEIQYFHDGLNRQVKSRQFLSASGSGATVGAHTSQIELRQSWDALDRVKTRTDASGNITAYVWDQLSRKVGATYGDGTSETWSYNADDELFTRTNKTGYLFTYSNDPEGRQEIEFVVSASKLPGDPDYLSYDTAASGITTCFFYDDLGRIWTHCAFNGPGAGDDVFVRYFYDSVGRRTYQHMLGVAMGESTHEYQGASRLVSETYPGTPVLKRKVWRAYDGLDRLVEVRENDGVGALIAKKEFIGHRRLAWMQYGNGTSMTKADPGSQQTTTGTKAGYDANRRHVRHEWKFGGAQVTGYVNAYNASNRRKYEVREHIGVAGHQDDYVFDSAYRMLSFRRDSNPGLLNGVPSSRVLDGADKMTTFSDEGVARSPQVDQVPAEAGLNQYSGFSGNARLYNKEGSLVERVGSSGKQTFGYDTLGRITHVHDALGAPVAQYVYDAENRRVVRVTTVAATQYYYDLRWRVMDERALGSATPAREYVDGSGVDEHLQMRVWTVLQQDDFYYHCNSQGFVGALTDAVGVRIVEYEYSWLGESRPTGSGLLGPAGQNPYAFQGRRFDPETELYLLRHRYYDPAVGEFWSLDPSGVWRHGQGNGYSSFACDAWHMSDPRGLDSKTPQGQGPKHPEPEVPGWGYDYAPPNNQRPRPEYGPHLPPSRGNCWRYACNDKQKPGEPHSVNPPGTRPPKPTDAIDCKAMVAGALGAIGNNAKTVGKNDKCPKCHYKIFMAIRPGAVNAGGNYHFYRQDPSGSWSHKPGYNMVHLGEKDPAAEANKRKHTLCHTYMCVPFGGIDV